MNLQNKRASTSAQADPSVKRKRGRPRKDENFTQKEKAQFPPPLPSDDVKRNLPIEADLIDNIINDEMVGQVVSGVIEGSFDAGYFLSVRAGNSNTLLRGVVFHPGLFTPISASNDIAPQAKMYRRKEFPIPVFNPQCQVNGSMMPQSTQDNEQPVGEKDVPQHNSEFGLENNSHSQLQSSASVSLPNQSTPITVPVSASLTMNDSTVCLEGKYMPTKIFEPGVEFLSAPQFQSVMVPSTNNTLLNNGLSGSFGGKNVPQPKCEFGLEKQSFPQFEHQRIIEHDKMMQEFDASTLSGVPQINLKGTKGVMGKEAFDQVVDCALEPSELARNELKGPDLELHHTLAIAKQSSDPVTISTDNPLSLKDDIVQTMHSELVENSIDGSAFCDAADKTRGVSESARVTKQPGMIEEEINPSESKNEGGFESATKTIQPQIYNQEKASSSEQSVLQGQVNPQISSSVVPSTEVDFVLKNAISRTQSHS